MFASNLSPLFHLCNAVPQCVGSKDGRMSVSIFKHLACYDMLCCAVLFFFVASCIACSVLVHKDGRLPPEFAALWSHPKLLEVARQLLVGGDQEGTGGGGGWGGGCHSSCTLEPHQAAGSGQAAAGR